MQNVRMNVYLMSDATTAQSALENHPLVHTLNDTKPTANQQVYIKMNITNRTSIIVLLKGSSS